MQRIYPALQQVELTSGRLLQVVDGNQEKPISNGNTGAAKENAVVTSASRQQVPCREPHFRVTSRDIAAGFPVLSLENLNTPVAEQLRMLRTNILQKAPNCSVLGITSAVPGDGKTVTSFNLSAVFALRSEARILVIDADMRNSGLTSALGLKSRAGLADVLKQTHDLDSALTQIDYLKNLYVLPAGVPSVHPAELLDSPVFMKLVADLRKRFSFIIFDTTPTQFLADFKLIQKVCDGVIMIVRPDHTAKTDLLNAIDNSEIEKLIGTVLNGVEDWFLWKSVGGYGYYSQPAPKKKSLFGRR